MENDRRLKKFFTILTLIFLFMTLTSPGFAKKKRKVKCHSCKEKDLELVIKHKKIGFDGCFKCHKDQEKLYLKSKGKKK